MKPWSQLSAFLSAVLLVGSAEATELDYARVAELDYACYGTTEAQACSQHSLQCQEGTIFVTSAQRIFLLESNSCHFPTRRCNEDHVNTCCRDSSRRYWEYYSYEALTHLVNQCWNKRNCTYTVQEATKHSWLYHDYKDESGYSRLRYLCLPARTVLDFNDNRTVTASSIELRYSPSKDKGHYVCRVEADDCSNQTVKVFLLRTETNPRFYEYCTSLSIDGGPRLPCGGWQNASLVTSTPFRVWLDVDGINDAHLARAVIYGNTKGALRVTCKPWKERNHFPKCYPATTSSTAPVTDPSTTGSQTTDSGEKTETTRAAEVQSSSTPHLHVVTSTELTAGNMPQAADRSSNTAGIVGGVVGALLVVALVVTFVFLKRRGAHAGPFPKVVSWFKGSNSSRSRGNSGRAEQRVEYFQPTSLPVYDNSVAAITDDAGVHVAPDSDYHHLGQKPTSSAPRDVTYGHLTIGNDVTDYGYDHTTKGKPAVRSGDVINNIYNTAGPATRGSCDEDFYNTTGAANDRTDVINNVYNTAGPPTDGFSDEDFCNTTGAAKNRPDVINNVYSTPSPASEASPDADYYNAAGLSQTGRDVINNHYDTPKAAKAPGP